jgi:uncharacterized protein with PIN domain
VDSGLGKVVKWLRVLGHGAVTLSNMARQSTQELNIATVLLSRLKTLLMMLVID